MLTQEDLKALEKILADETERRCAAMAASYTLAEAVRNLGRDMHQESSRHCNTCAAVSRALGELFGCDRLRKELEEMRKRATSKP